MYQQESHPRHNVSFANAKVHNTQRGVQEIRETWAHADVNDDSAQQQSPDPRSRTVVFHTKALAHNTQSRMQKKQQSDDATRHPQLKATNSDNIKIPDTCPRAQELLGGH